AGHILFTSGVLLATLIAWATLRGRTRELVAVGCTIVCAFGRADTWTLPLLLIGFAGARGELDKGTESRAAVQKLVVFLAAIVALALVGNLINAHYFPHPPRAFVEKPVRFLYLLLNQLAPFEWPLAIKVILLVLFAAAIVHWGDR